MLRAGAPRGPLYAALTAVSLLALSVGSAPPVHAFAPQAASTIARLLPSVLPPAARWNPAWGEVAAAVVERRLESEDEAAETSSPRHRFVSGLELPDPDRDEVSAAAAVVVGVSPRRLAAAATALRDAFIDGEDDEIVRALADLAVSAADLSDPFQVTSHELEEVPGARARFSDLIGPADLQDLAPAAWISPADVTQAGLDLAAQSAAQRAAVEDAVRSGNEAALKALRRERLGAGLGLARAAAIGAWEAARSPAISVSGTPLGVVRVWPNPAGPLAMLSFSLPRPGDSRLELYDAAGRRIGGKDLGFRPGGPQGARFGAGILGHLPPGIYMVRVSSPDYAAMGRLVHVAR